MYNIFNTVSQDTISRYLTVLHVTIKNSDARKRILSLCVCHVQSIFIERILFLSSRAIFISVASYFITLLIS